MPSLSKSKGAKGSSDSLTQLLKRITKVSKTRSRRNRSRSKPKTQSQTQKPAHPKDPLFQIKTVLQNYFETIGYEIQQTDPNFIPPTAEEFLYVCKQVETRIYKELKGKPVKDIRISPSLQTLLSPFPIHTGGASGIGTLTTLTIGTFDTTCNQIFSCISIACYAAATMYYVSPADQRPEYLLSIYGYAATFVQLVFPSLIAIQQGIVGALRSAIEPHVGSLVTKGTAAGVSAALNAVLNERIFKNALSCLLLRFGIQSCYPYCGFATSEESNHEE